MYSTWNSAGYCVNENNTMNYRKFHRGHSGFFCKKCFTPVIIRLNVECDFECAEDLEFDVHSVYSFKCPECGAKNKVDYEIDPNITPAIALLNKKGYKTKYCCEGHFTDEGWETAYIWFDKSVDPSIVNEYELPYPWYRDTEIQKDIDCTKTLTIRCHTDVMPLKQRISVLNKWVEELPELENYKSKNLEIKDSNKEGN